MEHLWTMSWVLIPLAGIALAAFEQWLKFRAETRRLGDSTRELDGQVERLEAERARLVRRVENLEHLVTSRLWETAREGGAAPPAELARLDLALGPVDEEAPPEEKVRRLAGRLGLD